MRIAIGWLLVSGLLAGMAGGAQAQGTEVAFGALTHDPTLPVEVTAERLAVDQSDGTAIFTGNVIIGQGEMRMTAPTVRVIYAQDPQGDATGEVQRMEATGGVTLVSGAEAAESRDAVYTIDSGQIVMTGDVLLTQARNAISGEKLTVDLTSGTGVMEGGVRTILQSGADR